VPAAPNEGCWIRVAGDERDLPLGRMDWHWRIDRPDDWPAAGTFPPVIRQLVGTFWLLVGREALPEITALVIPGRLFEIHFPHGSVGWFLVTSVRPEFAPHNTNEGCVHVVCDFASSGLLTESWIPSALNAPAGVLGDWQTFKHPPPEPTVPDEELTTDSLRTLLGEANADGAVVFDAEGGWRTKPSEN
jgi:hypothetical protein